MPTACCAEPHPTLSLCPALPWVWVPVLGGGVLAWTSVHTHVLPWRGTRRAVAWRVRRGGGGGLQLGQVGVCAFNSSWRGAGGGGGMVTLNSTTHQLGVGPKLGDGEGERLELKVAVGCRVMVLLDKDGDVVLDIVHVLVAT